MDEKTLRDAYEVFRDTFQSKMTWDMFRYKHIGNPERAEDLTTFVDYSEDGAARGSNSFMRSTFCTPAGELSATFSCDTAVRPEYQGQRIFSNIIKDAIERHKRADVDFICGVPNQNSYPGFLKLGFIELGKMERYVRVIRPAILLKRKVLRRPHHFLAFEEGSFFDRKGLQYEISLRCPFQDHEVEQINQCGEVRVKRSVASFRWRIDYMKPGCAAYICVRRNGQLIAFFVAVQRPGGICELVDWDFLAGAEDLKHIVLKRLLQYLRAHSFLVSVSYVNPLNHEAQLLQKARFAKDKRWNLPVLIYLLSEKAKDVGDFQSWKLRVIDMDTVLNDFGQ